MSVSLGPFSFDRVVAAVEDVRRRLLRATAALDAAQIPYAVAGSNAVANWVSRVDKAAVRFIQDVNILIRREQLDATKVALELADFIYRHTAGLDVFLDGATGKARDAVHILFANEKVKPHETVVNPDVSQSEQAPGYKVLNLPALVQIKLTAFRDKDRTHLRDMIDVGLVDKTWPERFPEELGSRLQLLLDTPEG